MKNIMTYLQSSPLYPPESSGQALKGRIAENQSRYKLVTNTPLRGQGVSKYENILFP
jgi:hypothetical protein